MAERPYEVAEDTEFYPMALFPQLAVSDVERSTAWYERLGFEAVFSYGETVHLRYATGADLMLVGRGAPADAGAGVAVYVNTSESLEDVFERMRAADPTVEGPTETPYNTRELRLHDPDGYELVFSEPVDTDRSFEDVMSGA